MKIARKSSLLTALIFLPLLFFCCSSSKPPLGISYEKRLLEGPITAHILEVDPKRCRIMPAHAGDQILCLETASTIAKCRGAYAAVNGGFFRMKGCYAGTPSGSLKIAGEWLSSPRHNRGAIGWKMKNYAALIDRIALKSEVVIEEQVYPVDGINQPRYYDQSMLYHSNYAFSTGTDIEGYEVAIDANSIVLFSERTGNSPLPLKGWVYSVGPFCSLKPPPSHQGATAFLSFLVQPLNHPENEKEWNQCDNIVGGTPVLIDQGRMITDYNPEKLPIGFWQNRHARTAVGIKSNGNWVFTVIEEKPSGSSLGMTMEELTHFMHSLGCVNALNLDGGGSSTLYLNGKVMNDPSIDEDDPSAKQGDERLISDAILIFLDN